MKNTVRFTVDGEDFDFPEPIGLAILEEIGVNVDKERFRFGTDFKGPVTKLRRKLRDFSTAIESMGTKVAFAFVRHEFNVLGNYLTIDKGQEPWLVKMGASDIGTIEPLGEDKFHFRSGGAGWLCVGTFMKSMEKLVVLAGGRHEHCPE